jgi:zinc-dependent metalloproteinase lipoprotein
MKRTIRYGSLALTAALLLTGCTEKNDENAPSLAVAPTSFADIAAAGDTLSFTVKSNVDWQLTNPKSWCTTSALSGNGTYTLKLFVDENVGQTARGDTIMLTSAANNLSSNLKLSQLAPTASASYHYKMPVIFHVLYTNKSDSTQYVKEGYLKKLLAYVNKLYANCGVDLNMELTMATEDPNGNTLSEPGVDRVYVANSTINCENFMSTYNQTNYLKMLWNLNKYVNVMLYTFTNANILGISSLPYTVANDTLTGLTKLPYYVAQNTVPIPLCVCINNTYIYNHIEGGYSSVDPVTSLAHELGHYFGLRHAFSESDDGNTDLCYDSDYCDDTPTYNYTEYTANVNKYLANHSNTLTMADYNYLCERTNCKTNGTFVSTNFMDYGVGHFNAFTADQLARMRYVMLNCPYVPGPKLRKWYATSYTRTDQNFTFPVQVMK